MTEFKINRGINLSHWLSQRFGWSPMAGFIVQDDIQQIKQQGFDHVRLPVDEEVLWDETGSKIAVAWEMLHACIGWCDNAGLKIIVDLHILRSHHFNSANEAGPITLWTEPAAQVSFLNNWTQLQDELSQYSVDLLAFEIMNEPVAENHDDWNILLGRAYSQIRNREAGRIMIIGSNRWQVPENFPFLKLPANSTNIILSCHFYEPFLITHYKAYWVPTKHYHGPVNYPGTCIKDADIEAMSKEDFAPFSATFSEKQGVYDKDKFAEMLEPAIAIAEQYGFPLYCSEFGCLPSIDRPMRLKYYEDLMALFSEKNIASCHWDYLGDFGARSYNRETNEKGVFDSQLIALLVSQ